METPWWKEIVWFAPAPVNKPAITITTEDYITINPPLVSELPERVKIGVHPTEGKIVLTVPDGESHTVRKNGRIRDRAIVAALIKAGITLPARIVVQRDNNAWIGTAVPAAPSLTRIRTKPKRATRGEMEALAKEADELCNPKITRKKH